MTCVPSRHHVAILRQVVTALLPPTWVQRGETLLLCYRQESHPGERLHDRTMGDRIESREPGHADSISPVTAGPGTKEESTPANVDWEECSPTMSRGDGVSTSTSP